MQERLNRMEAQSILSIHQLQARMKAHEKCDKKGAGLGSRVMRDRVEAELTYRCIQKEPQEDADECFFEMDENRNYVRESSQKMSCSLGRNLVEAR
jgi:hypothetical protein